MKFLVAAAVAILAVATPTLKFQDGTATKIIEYDGTNDILTVPQHCRQDSCDTMSTQITQMSQKLDALHDAVHHPNSGLASAHAKIESNSAVLGWDLVKQFDGQFTIPPSTYTSVCGQWSDYGANFVFKVEMGTNTDYYRAANTETNFCDVVATPGATNFQWSASGEAGTWTDINHYGHHLGGSQSQYPNNNIDGDSRQYLPFWGDDVGHVGGCCHDTKTDAAAWNRAFKMMIKYEAYDQSSWQKAAEFDGSATITPAMWESLCAPYNDMGANFVFKVVMGDNVDYYRGANAGVNFCDVVATVAATNFQWSPSGAYGSWTTPNYYGHHLGGSQSQYPNNNIDGDSRQYLPFWGDNAGHVGGCCHNTKTDAADWNRAFKVLIRSEIYDETTWQAVHTNDGSSTIVPGVYSQKCTNFNGFGANFVFKVEMGENVDYYRGSSSSVNFCDIVSTVGATNFQWSPTGADGSWTTPNYYGHHLGGSQSQYPNNNIDGDSRQYLPFWGDNAGHVGGCCHNTKTDAADWNRAFTMSIRKHTYA